VAIMKDSVSIIACHNHPSGDPHPSVNDIKVTKRLKSAGEILGIKLLDHIILGHGNYISMMKKGIIDNIK